MSEQPIRLRVAAPADLPRLLELMDSVLSWLVARGRTQQWGDVPFSRIPGFPDRVADWIAQRVITLAERGTDCVGILAMAPVVPQRIPAGLVPASAMFVHTVMTERGPRGRGVGSLLMQEAERQARAASAPAVALDHWAGSDELQRIYHKHGYTPVGEYNDERANAPTRNVVQVLHLPST
ncbi:GNAT family N-acetyltransferase [Asanoa sp. WMMD1127]|uniref:GNAT family N-acetyltransferase n=1 Tax=Asanoa sp. WMMD1127 TaxID=3016107 RepID=UPI002417CEEC|nr:GNAT family N-acetyltransferase [Asanoa sp. WMMD1127]MDG4824853.1 GNAT family N-acetyltransferase [Asanoa sp. WMMD1127]